MPMFVVLGKWTAKRMETIKDLPKGIKQGPKVFESYGVKIQVMLFTMGRYDLIAVGDSTRCRIHDQSATEVGQCRTPPNRDTQGLSSRKND